MKGLFCFCEGLPGEGPLLGDRGRAFPLPLMLTMCTAGRAGGTLHYFVLKEMPPSSALASLNFTTTKFTPSGLVFFFFFLRANESSVCSGGGVSPPVREA